MLRYASTNKPTLSYLRQDPSSAYFNRRRRLDVYARRRFAVPGIPDSQHGGPVAALLATEMELLAPRPGCGSALAHFLSPVPVRRPLQVMLLQIVRPGKDRALRSALWSAEEAPASAARPVCAGSRRISF